MEGIYYKVVSKETRYGSNAIGFLSTIKGSWFPNWEYFYTILE